MVGLFYELKLNNMRCRKGDKVKFKEGVKTSNGLILEGFYDVEVAIGNSDLPDIKNSLVQIDANKKGQLARYKYFVYAHALQLVEENNFKIHW